VTGVDARFTGVVFPGDELEVSAWRLGTGEVYARVRVPARDATVVDPLLVTVSPSP
jgi:acyl dehydratase